MKTTLFLVILIGLISCSKNQPDNLYELSNAQHEKAVVLNEKASTFFNHAQLDSALFYYNLALREDSSYYLPHANKACIYIKKGMYQKALIECETTVKLKVDMPQIWFMAGLMNEQLGDDKAAQHDYRKSMEIYAKKLRQSNSPHVQKTILLNLALTKQFLGDSTYLEDYKTLSNWDNHRSLVDYMSNASREEMMQRFVK